MAVKTIFLKSSIIKSREGSHKLSINALELFQHDLLYRVLFAMLARIEKVHDT